MRAMSPGRLAQCCPWAHIFYRFTVSLCCSTVLQDYCFVLLFNPGRNRLRLDQRRCYPILLHTLLLTSCGRHAYLSLCPHSSAESPFGHRSFTSATVMQAAAPSCCSPCRHCGLSGGAPQSSWRGHSATAAGLLFWRSALASLRLLGPSRAARAQSGLLAPCVPALGLPPQKSVT